jgi:cytochrome bd-type quinol oxidase subunit 2
LFSLYQLFLLRKRIGFLVIDRIFLFILGFLGLALLCMWFLTDHNATKWNLNVLWASPILLVLAFHSLQKSKPWFSILLMVQLALVILVALGTLFPTISPQYFNSSILPLALAEMVVLIRIILIRKKLGIHHYI